MKRWIFWSQSVAIVIMTIAITCLGFVLIDSRKEIQDLKEELSVVKNGKDQDRSIIRLWEKTSFEWKRKAMELEEEVQKLKKG